MAEKELALPKNEDVNAEDAAAKKLLEKNQTSQLVTYAYVDPDSIIGFELNSRITAYFGIDRVPDGASGNAKIYGTKKEPAAGANKKRSSIDGVSFMQKVGAGKRIYKAIRVPTGGDYESGKAKKKFKFVTLRVPASMNLNAIVLWINTCWKTEAKRPEYFITERGMRCFIDKTYKDKGKLRALKEAK